MSVVDERVAYVAVEMRRFPDKVHIGFSGGKDSSAVVKILLNAQLQLKGRKPKIEIIYCDTEVENQIIDRYVKTTLRRLDAEFRTLKINAATKIIRPLTKQSFFVRLIGRGYPPPTNSFRWCTTDIRIRPFQSFLRHQKQVLIAVGTRMGESQQRDRSLKKSSISREGYEFYQRQREGFSAATLFAPIIDFSVEDVWDSLLELELPAALNAGTLAQLYKDGGGECPAIRDFEDKPCSRARFGCWTCTVVRRDRSTENMIAQGYDELRPYFAFREWLTQMRNEPANRCRLRRSGAEGPGPLTLEARALVLKRTRVLEGLTGRRILSKAQESEIERLWELDRRDPSYSSIE